MRNLDADDVKLIGQIEYDPQGLEGMYFRMMHYRAKILVVNTSGNSRIRAAKWFYKESKAKRWIEAMVKALREEKEHLQNNPILRKEWDL